MLASFRRTLPSLLGGALAANVPGTHLAAAEAVCSCSYLSTSSRAADTQQVTSGAGRQRRFGPPLPADASLLELPFEQLRERLAETTKVNPRSEEALALLIRKASTPEDLQAALSLVRINVLRRGRQRQYGHYSPELPSAILQAAKRTGAGPSVAVSALLEQADQLGIVPSKLLCEKLLRYCGAEGDAAALQRAFVFSRLHCGPPRSTHVVAVGLGLMQQGRQGEAAKLLRRHAQQGGHLSPMGQKLLQEAVAAAAAQKTAAKGVVDAGEGGDGAKAASAVSI